MLVKLALILSSKNKLALRQIQNHLQIWHQLPQRYLSQIEMVAPYSFQEKLDHWLLCTLTPRNCLHANAKYTTSCTLSLCFRNQPSYHDQLSYKCTVRIAIHSSTRSYSTTSDLQWAETAMAGSFTVCLHHILLNNAIVISHQMALAIDINCKMPNRKLQQHDAMLAKVEHCTEFSSNSATRLSR